MEQTKIKWPLDGANRSRESVARAIDGLQVPENARDVLRAILGRQWPEAHDAPLDSVVIDIPELQALTGKSKGTISPLQCWLRTAGWIETPKVGRKLSYRLNFAQLFEVGPVQPVQCAAPEIGPVKPELDRSKPETAGNLDRSNRSNVNGPTGPEDALDAFTPEERLLNAIEDNTLALRERTAAELETQRLLRAILDRLDRPSPDRSKLDRSKWSKRSKKRPYISISINKYRTLKTKDNTLQPERPQEERKATPMVGDFVWDKVLYPLTRDKLRDNRYVEKLLANAVKRSQWPDGKEGREQFFELVCYALAKDRGVEGPGKLVSAAVQQGAHGERLWTNDDARKRARQRIGAPPAPERAPPPEAPTRPRSPALPDDVAERLNQIANEMSDEDVLALPLDANTLKTFQMCRKPGKPLRAQAGLRLAILRAIADREQLQAPGPFRPPAKEVDTSALDLEFA